MFRATRLVLYPFLFACMTVLLGLTAYRVHYTKTLDQPDVLTTRTHYYDPRIVGLMVASIVGVIFTIAMIGALVASVDIVIGEHISIWILWIFFLITTALVTRQFSNLKWCRSHKVCSVLETIKAFGWICWGLLSILLVVTLIKLVLSDTGSRRNRGTRGAAAATAIDTRQTGTPATVHDQPRTTQPVQSVPATHGAQTKQNTHMPVSQHQSAPTTTTGPGALYHQDV